MGAVVGGYRPLLMSLRGAGSATKQSPWFSRGGGALDSLERLAARSRSLLAANRRLLDGFLNSRKDREVVRPAARTIAFTRLRHGEADHFCRLLREKYDAPVVPGRFVEMPEHFRVGIGVETRACTAATP